MPYQKDGKRDYKREYKEYHGKPEQIKNRDKRNKARAEMEEEHGDLTGKDVDHKKPLIKGGSNEKDNLRLQDPSENRSVAKTKKKGTQKQKMKGNG